MAVAPVFSGQLNAEFGKLTTTDTTSHNAGVSGTFVGVGSFTATAAGVTTISDAAVQANSKVIFCAATASAGLLMQAKTCWVDTILSGSFVFNVSATGAGAPAGTEAFNYFVLSES